MSRAVSARYDGVQRLPGIIDRRRASAIPSPIAVPRSTASTAASSSLNTIADSSSARRSSAGGGVLRSAYSQAPVSRPTVTASTAEIATAHRAAQRAAELRIQRGEVGGQRGVLAQRENEQRNIDRVGSGPARGDAKGH